MLFFLIILLLFPCILFLCRYAIALQLFLNIFFNVLISLIFFDSPNRKPEPGKVFERDYFHYNRKNNKIITILIKEKNQRFYIQDNTTSFSYFNS